MDECLLPSEIARLVFGYLEDEGCAEAAQKFLETSENLKECRLKTSQGVRFRTRVLGFNLVEMLQLISSVYSLVEERTRRTPVPKHIAHGSFLEQLNYLLNASDISNDSPTGVSENNTGLLKALNRTMFENTTFHKRLAENINKMRTTPEGLAPETIAESIVKEKGFEEIIEELLDAVPTPETNQTGGKSSKENRPVKCGTININTMKEHGRKKTPDSSFDSAKLISNCNQISLEDENAAAVQSILESCCMPSWKGGRDQSDSAPKSAADRSTNSTSPQKQSSLDNHESIIEKAMVDCVTPLKEIAFNTYNNTLNLELTTDQEDLGGPKDDTGSVGGESVNGDLCNKSATSGLDHNRADSTSGLALPSPQVLTCTPLLLVCDTPNSQNQKVSLGVTSYNLHTKAEDRRIKSRFRRILPKPTSTQESNGKIAYPNGVTVKVLNQSMETDQDNSKEIYKIAENQAKVDNRQAENRIDESIIGDVNENLILEKTGLPDIQDSGQSLEVIGEVVESEQLKTDLCSAETVGDSLDQGTTINKSNVEDKITPVDRQGPRKKLSLSTPRRGRHIRSLDFNTPNKKILGQRSKTSPKQILHQQRFRHSKLRSNLFKSPPNKLQTIQDTVEKVDEQIEKSIEDRNENDNQDVASNVPVEKNVSEVMKLGDDVDRKVQDDSPLKIEKSRVNKSIWDSNLRALVGETTNSCSARRPRKKLNRKVMELKKRAAMKKIEEIKELNTTDELNDQTSPSKDLSSEQNANESEATAGVDGTKEEVSKSPQATSGIEPKTSPQPIFQTPLKLDQPIVPQTPILDTPLLKSIIDDTRTIDPDLLLTPSFRMTPFKTPRSEKKVMVQTLSPSKMLINNKTSEKIKIESLKKSPTLRSGSSNPKSSNTKNPAINVSPKPNRQRNQSPKNGTRNNGTSGKSDLIQSLMKQAEKSILGDISDMESDDDEENGTKAKSSVKCSKKGNKKHKMNRFESRENNEVSNKRSTSNEGSVLTEEDSETKPKETSPGKKKSPSKKDKIQDFSSVNENKIPQINDSALSNSQNQSAKVNDEVFSKSASSHSVNSNLPNDSQEKMDSSKMLNDNNSSSCNSIPPKKKYVQTILLSTSTSMKSKKSMKGKGSSVNSNSVVESSSSSIVVEGSNANSEIAFVSPSKSNSKAGWDKRTSSTDQQTIDFLLEKKKRLMNKLKEPDSKSRKKKKNCADVVTASTSPVQKRIGIQTKNAAKNKSQTINKSASLAASKRTNESSLNFSSESSLSPIKTSTPFIDKVAKLRNNNRKNAENKFSPSNRLGKTFSEIATKISSSNTSTKNPSTVEEVSEVVSDQNQQVPEPSSPTPLDKREAGKRILVGNELYEHVFHDETRPVRVSTQQPVVGNKDLSISICDFDMDGNEIETVFVAQPLITLFEFLPPASNEKPDEVQLLNRKGVNDGVKKDYRPTDNSQEIVSRAPPMNGTHPPPVNRSSRLVQMVSDKVAIVNQGEKPRQEAEERCYNLHRNMENSKTRHPTEKTRDRYSSSPSPRRDSHEKNRSERRRSSSRSGRNRNRSRDRSRERHRSKSRHRDKSRGRHRFEHRRHSRRFSRSRERSRSSDRTRRKESRRDSKKHRAKSSHSSGSRTKHHDKEKHDDMPKKVKKLSPLREDDSSEDGEVHSKSTGSSDECQSATTANSHQNQTSSRSSNDAPAARNPSKTQLGKRPSNDVSRNVAEKRPKTDDAQKLLKNMDSEHLEKFLSVVHPDD
ncbi:hypothetical protein LSTR_LSTR003852 [Laodelphax striatellus]|uniref:Uncharacterized protein n=1 Tax=Laodelphax striatellus TaxID=195883 RepID=A0A482XET7_LAOST|nr:hypothetical protein LSTR_LSTR003852 [Laodelphax striatellus]